MKEIKTKTKKRILAFLMVIITAVALICCGSQQRFGQRKAPKNCNTCTKWSK